jgi:hypothetical protein
VQDRNLFLPSPGTILGFIAVIISLGSVAYAAGALVTIVDPVTSSKAKVSAGGRLEVSVDEPVTTRLASPAATFHTFNSMSSASGCINLATPPAGTGFVIQQVRVNTHINPTPGTGQFVAIYSTANCSTLPKAGVNPPTIGFTSVTFGPGLTIPQGQAISARVNGSVQAEIFVDGFRLPAAQVPASSEIEQSGPTAKQTQHLQRH